MSKEREPKGQPFVSGESRPDLTVDLNQKVGELSVRDLASILGTGGGAAIKIKEFFKERKDFKDIKEHKDQKEHKDHKDIKDILIEKNPLIEVAKDLTSDTKVTAENPGDPQIPQEGLQELINRVSGLEAEVANLRGSSGGKG